MQQCVETLPVLNSGKVESKKIKMLSGPIKVDELGKQTIQSVLMNAENTTICKHALML